MELSANDKTKLVRGVLTLMILASVYFGVRVVSEIKSYRYIGGGIPAGNTMSFTGSGEVFAAPDIALVNATVREEGTTPAEAQDKATAKEKKVLDFLAESGIDKKDIKTESYNTYPKYDYGTPCYSYGLPCRQEAPKIVGYEVSENISVKVRDLTKAGDIVKGVGAAGIAELSGPNFSIENEDKLQEDARKMAIDEAKEKAEALAKDLGVHLVRIVNFSEDGAYPMMYNFAAKDTRVESAAGAAVPAPMLPTGENKITSNVTITYEIR